MTNPQDGPRLQAGAISLSRTGSGWFETLLQDTRFALRQLRRNPGFAVVAILTLALGIGANTAIFSLVHAVLFKSLPVANPRELYSFGENPNGGDITGIQNDYSVFSFPLYEELRDHTSEFSELAAFSSRLTPLSVRRSSENLASPFNGEYVSGNYFKMFGVSAALGRTLTPADDRPEAPPVVMISHRAWSQHYGGDPAVIGGTFIINSHPMTVVGVAPPGFFGDSLRSDPPDFWFPVSMELVFDPSARRNHAEMCWLFVAGRILPGREIRSSQAHLTTQLQQWLSAQKGNSSDNARAAIAKAHIALSPAGGGIGRLRRNYTDGLRMLMAISGLVLLITCANIANLLLARGASNRTQTGVRVALGASRGRLVRQTLTEGILLALLGGLAGIIVAFAGTRVILYLAFRGAHYVPIEAAPSPAVLVFAFCLAVVTGVIFSVMPSWAASRIHPVETMRGSGRSTRDRSALPQKSLAVLQAALSLVLLIAAGLLTQSLRNMEKEEFGFETQGRFTLKVDPALAGYTPERLAGLYLQLQTRLAEIPGVRSVSFSFFSPMSGTYWVDPVRIEGRESPENPADANDSAFHDHVSAGYFETLGTRVLRGRAFDEHDTPASRHVAVVNQTFVRKYFGQKEPIGRHVDFGDFNFAGNYEIVGVVQDSRYVNARRPPDPMIFFPLLQMANYTNPSDIAYQNVANSIRSIQLRVAGPAANLEGAVRQALAGINPNLVVQDMMSLEDQVGISFNNPRMTARITSLYGLLALLVASVGLYGVAAYTVARRTSEIGIRIALGANRANVVMMVLRFAMLPIILGLMIGIPAAVLGGRTIASQLYGVTGYDPLVLAASTSVLAVCALVAGIVPARRAAAVDPIRALRTE